MMQWAVLSDKGSREINEDSVGIINADTVKVFVIADGLGGHGKGDIASKLAVSSFENVFMNSTSDPAKSLSDAFNNAQASILSEQKRTGCIFQMKTTVSALVVGSNTATWGHIGDSRVYAFSHNRVKLRTLDHSVPQMLVLARDIKEKDIRNHPDRNKLLRVLGVSGDSPKYEISDIQDLRKYQAFLLCSDGFWELIFEKEMCSLLKKSRSVDEWLKAMQEIVEDRGKNTDMDNFSAIAIWV